MPKSGRNILLPAFILFVASSAPKKVNSAESDVLSASKGLPIIGTWSPVSYDGYYYTQDRSRQRVSLSAERLRPDDWTLESKIDSNGNGYIKTKIDCRAEKKTALNKPPGIPSPRSLGLFPNSLHLRSCDIGKSVKEDRDYIIISIAPGNIPRSARLQQNDKSLLESCSLLRGLRFIQHTSSHGRYLGFKGCIGFTDSKANQIALMLIPLHEIHPVRIDFKRIK